MEYGARDRVERVDEWEIVEALGRGDFGMVYDVVSGNEHFALKLCTTSVGEARERMSFERDALRRILSIPASRALLLMESMRIVLTL